MDHWLALEDLGINGSEVDLPLITVNLWPQSFQTEIARFEMLGAHEKDRVETWLHEQLCNGRITSGQVQIALHQWPEIYLALEQGADPLAPSRNVLNVERGLLDFFRATIVRPRLRHVLSAARRPQGR